MRFVRIWLWVAFVAVTCEAVSQQPVAGRLKDSRPNIILILADDLGWSDLGCYGGEIATPHLDHLAEQGTRFTQFYNGARCCPTRAQLLTGLYAHQAGIGFMEPTNGYNQHFKHIPEYQGVLNRQCVTLAEVLHAAGYQTFMCGKWHVGAAEGQRPLDRGFQRFFGIHGGASHFFRPRPGQFFDQDQPLSAVPDDFYTTDYLAKYAQQYISEARDDSPFFLYLAFTAPHWPLHAWPEDIAKYQTRYGRDWERLREQRFARQKQLGLFAAETKLSPLHSAAVTWMTQSTKDMDLRMAVYAAMVDRMDQAVGQVLEALRRAGRDDNTIIFFLSDNGACAEPVGKDQPDAQIAGQAKSFQGTLLPWAHASNTPFRQFKHWTHEGGIATPFVAYWPHRIPAGVINRKQIGHVIDFMPTVLELSDGEYPQQVDANTIQPLEGQSLLPALLNPENVLERTLYWEHEGNRAIRQGRWKAVAHYNDNLGDTNVALGKRSGVWQLYDMDADRTETNDLSGTRREKLNELTQLHAAWEQRIGVRDWESLLKLGGLDSLP